LPGGKAALLAIRKGGGFSDTDVGVLSLENGEWHTIIEGGTSPHYLSSGHLVYARAGALLSVPFDLEQLKTTGSPVKILEGVMTMSGAEFSLSADGSMAYIPGAGARPKFTLVWVDREGRAEALPLPPAAYSNPRLSPDSRRLVTTIVGQETGNEDIWVSDLLDPD
jgi:hypothetical protein